MLQIHINSDKNIGVNAELSKSIEADLHRILDRFEEHLTRLEVHLSDVNAEKPGLHDKRCLLEARPKSHQPVTTDDKADDIQEAVTGAAEKMKRLLESTFGRLADKRS
jgi:ribosome-associated translation inhibitor RaiA